MLGDYLEFVVHGDIRKSVPRSKPYPWKEVPSGEEPNKFKEEEGKPDKTSYFLKECFLGSGKTKCDLG